jgi:hypothetical protein
MLQGTWEWGTIKPAKSRRTTVCTMYKGAQRYPDINTRPDELLQRLNGIQNHMDLLKERNWDLEENIPCTTNPTAPSVQNPNMFYVIEITISEKQINHD